MKTFKSIFAVCACFLAIQAKAADAPPVQVRPAIFSTSTDWEAVTGLYLKEYRLTFGSDSTLGNIGTELYYLDGFPCYGQTDSVFTWIAPVRGFSWDKDAFMRLTCLVPPTQLQFAWRPAKKEATEGKTKGIITCKIDQKGPNIQIKLNECEMGKDWKDM